MLAHPGHHRAFDHAGLAQHQLAGAGGITHRCLCRFVQLAPGRAFAVEQLFPADSGYPCGEMLRRDALLLEVVKLVVHTVVCEPSACFFNGVAVGDAI